MTTRTSASYRLTLTVGLCFLVALMEGLDLQAAGIAAVGIAHAFALDKMQMGCSACSRWRRRFPGISHRWCLPV